MEYLLTSQPIFKSKREGNYTPKKKILYQFKILEEKKCPNNIRSNYFIKFDPIAIRCLSNTKHAIIPTKTKENFPLIKIKENISLINTKKNPENKRKKLLLNRRYQSKEEVAKSTLLSYTRMKRLKIRNTYMNDNISFSENKNKKILSKKISINNSQLKKGNSIYDELLEEAEKSDLKVIKLSKINNSVIDDTKKNSCNNREYDRMYNPIKININGQNNYSKNDKLIIGSKYSTFDLSPDSIPKNIFYSRLNTYYNKINEKNDKSNHEKKINLSKLDLHNIKLKNYHNQKIKKCKKLINETVKEVNGVKNHCLNWVNELREKYSDLYKGCGIENNEDNKI